MESKEVRDLTSLESIINRATVCRIGLSGDGMPYVVPMVFGYRDSRVYLHSSLEGRKMDLLRANDNVCFEVDIDHEIVMAETSCSWGIKYRSIIGFGKARLIEDEGEKREALDVIMEHYSSANAHDYPRDILGKTAIIKIELETITGKVHGYPEGR